MSRTRRPPSIARWPEPSALALPQRSGHTTRADRVVNHFYVVYAVSCLVAHAVARCSWRGQDGLFHHTPPWTNVSVRCSPCAARCSSRSPQRRILTRHFQCLHLITSPSHCCNAAWAVNCSAAASSALLGAKTICNKPLPKSGPIHALHGTGEEQQLDHVAMWSSSPVVAVRPRASKWKGTSHCSWFLSHIPVTPRCAVTISSGVPFGAQMA